MSFTSRNSSTSNNVIVLHGSNKDFAIEEDDYRVVNDIFSTFGKPDDNYVVRGEFLSTLCMQKEEIQEQARRMVTDRQVYKVQPSSLSQLESNMTRLNLNSDMNALAAIAGYH